MRGLKMGSRLIWATLLIVTCGLLLASGEEPEKNQKVSKIQVRISHETNNLDIDEGRPPAEREDAVERRQNVDQASLNLTTSKNVTSLRIPKEKSNRRLSDIWSMFLPGSSDRSTDYEDEDEASSELSKNQTDEKSLSTPSITVSNITQDEPPNREKLSRPLRRDETVPGSGEGNSSSPINTTEPSKNNDQPVQLITGSLSSKDIITPSMNDIVSSIMNSMSATGSEKSNSAKSESEREDDSSETTKNTTTKEFAFERWLNRMKFEGNMTSTTEKPSRSSSSAKATFRDQSDSHEGVKGGTKPSKSSHKQLKPEGIAQKIEQLNELRSKEEQHQRELQHQLKTSLTSSRASQRARQTAAGVSSSLKPSGSVDRFSRHKSQTPQQHPFQQKLVRQQQAQLIHGIKYPAAQASTISVNQAQDDSSLGNTSFQNSLSLLNSLKNPSNEMSQIVSPNSLRTAGNSGDQSGSFDENGVEQQSVYQSQDEILRQVTSAINFEQQQELNNRKELNNHRKSGESALGPAPVNSESSTEGISRLFKTGSNLNELMAGEGNTTRPSSAGSLSPEGLLLKAALNGNNQSSSMLGMDEIDKSFDLLAEKLRQFAQHQQLEANNGSSQDNPPSWLRRPALQHQHQEMMAKFASALSAGNNSLGANSTGSNLENLRDLLEKYERNKVVNLKHQIQLRQQQGISTTANPQTSLIKDETSEGEGAELEADQPSQQGDARTPSGVSNVGWTPVKPTSVNLSPANFLKGKYPKQPVKISQLADNIGIGEDMITDGDKYFMNNLASMLANSAEAGAIEQAELGGMNDHKIIGLPIAILKDEEGVQPEGVAQLEAAALLAHSAGHGREQVMTNGPRNVGRNIPHAHNVQFASSHANQQNLANDPNQLNQIQKIVQGYSPQTFQEHQQLLDPGAQLLRRPHEFHHFNNMASLINSEQFHNNEHHNHLLNEYQNTMATKPPNEPLVNVVPEAPSSNVMENAHHGHENQHSNQQPQEIGRGRMTTKNESPKLQKQAQQQQIQMLSRNNQQLQRQNIVEYPSRPDLVQAVSIDRHPLPPPMPHFTTTTVSNQGPPVRLRELSLYKPFGFRSHHSIAYQASPTVSALFPGLAHGAPRPSLLRQMSPFRASFREGQRILAPLMPQPFAEALHNRYHQAFMGNNNHNQFQTFFNSLPLPPPPHLSPAESSQINLPQQQFVRYGNQMRRHTPSSPSWHRKQSKSSDVHNLILTADERPDYGVYGPRERGIILGHDQYDHFVNQENASGEDLKYNLPMDSFVEPLRMNQQDGRSESDFYPTKLNKKSPKKVPSEIENHRQQRTKLEQQILEDVVSNKTIPCLQGSTTTSTTTIKPIVADPIVWNTSTPPSRNSTTTLSSSNSTTINSK